MFIIRYIDVNKTVHMRIRKPIIIGSILIGTMLMGTYYCENKMIQFIALCITAIYAVLTNVDMLKSGMKLVKSHLGKQVLAVIKESISHDLIFSIRFLLLLFRRVVDKLEVQSIYRYIALILCVTIIFLIVLQKKVKTVIKNK